MHQAYELMYCTPLFLDKLVMSMTPPDTVCWYLQQCETCNSEGKGVHFVNQFITDNMC